MLTNPTIASQHAPKRSTTAGLNMLLTEAASGPYLASFFPARCSAATPEEEAEDGLAASAAPAHGSVTAHSVKEEVPPRPVVVGYCTGLAHTFYG